ncbi:hypothetical protein CDAR_406691 [Caerostris darwini]|uniref:Uncharacterized protein n=1 Tax=Caerostris darwini TaxID=1538125 RepID=A0AAV4R9M1_9ARAC|nr:hypothetical protein CDAR_406691 [Caerostris darwini]
MFILVAFSCLAVAQASGFYDVYPQFVPTYERAVGNYGYSDFRGVGRQVKFEATPAGLRALVRTNEVALAPQFPLSGPLVSGFPYNYGGVVASPAVVASPSVVYGGLGPYGLRSGYNGYGLGYNGYGYRGVLGYSGLLGGYGGVIGLRK